MLEKILQENRELRDAMQQATQRICALEDKQTQFFSEDIFDVINAVHSGGFAGESELAGLDDINVTATMQLDKYQDVLLTGDPDRYQAWRASDVGVDMSLIREPEPAYPEQSPLVTFLESPG